MRNVGRKMFGFCLLLFVVGVSGLVWLFSKQEYFTFSLKQVNEERTFSQTITSLNLSTDTTDVVVGRSGQSSAVVRLVGEAADKQRERLQLASEVSPDGTLNVTLQEQRKFDLFFMGQGRLKLQVLLPEAVYERIALHTATGDIRSGALAAKLADVSTSTGDIDLEGFQGGQLNIDTETGDMKLLGIHSSVKIESSTGDVNQLVLSDLARDVEIRTDTGDVHISADKKPTAGKLELESDTGDIRVDWPQLAYEEQEEHRVKASVGTGGAVLSVKTATGDIRIQ